MKRILSFMMAFAMLFTALPGTSYAKEALPEGTVRDASYDMTVADNTHQTVNLGVGETVVCKQDGGKEVDNPNLDGLDTSIAVGEVVAGNRVTYPYSVAKLATATATYNGQELAVEDCLFTFTSDESADGYVISHTREDGSVVYLSHNTNAVGAGYPCNGNRSVVTVGFEEDMFSFNNNGSYLFFWKNDSSKLHFDRQSGPDKTNFRTYFDVFVPAEDAPLDTEIRGYKKLTGMDELVSGQQYLIAAKAADNNYYVLNPVASGEKYNFVAQIVTGQAGVQLASSQGNFDVEGLKSSSDCLFTFTATEEAGKYVISAETAEGTTVYLNHKLASSKIPTTQNSAVITVAKKSDEEPGTFTLYDNSTTSGAGGYLYFHRNSGYFYDRMGSEHEYCYFELYKPSFNAPADSPVKGYEKVASAEDIKDGGQYLIVSTDTNSEPGYYVMYPSIGRSNYQHVAKMTDVTVRDTSAGKNADTTISFTGVAEGQTSVTIGGITYDVVVKNEDRTLIIRTAEKIYIPCTWYSIDESQTVISIKDETTAPYTAAEKISDGYYLLGSATHLVINKASSSTTPKGLAMQAADYTSGDYDDYIWNITAKGDGYTMQDMNGKYINFVEQSGSQCSVVLSDTPQILNIAKRSNGSFAVSYGKHYINNFSHGNSNAAGWSGNDNDWYFYRVGIEITNLTEGTTTLTLEGVDYRIEVLPTSAEELEADIAYAESTYAKADYLEREWRAYEAALAEAKEWAAKEAIATQPEINAAREKLASAIEALIDKPVYVAPTVNELAAGAPSGTTKGQPFAVGTGGSTHFRIPSMITLSDGTIIAGADSRWSWYGDACSIDIMISKSTDNGENWEYSLPAFFNDSTNKAHSYGACFIDTVLVRDKNDKIYLLADLFPGGIANAYAPGTPHAASGYVDILGEKRMVLYTMDDPNVQNDSNYSYYVGDYVTEGNQELAPIYEVYGEGEYADTASYYMDSHFYLYDAQKEPMYCLQLADETKKVQQNVFFHNSILHVRAAIYLYLITSEDHGETWSDPMILNPYVRKETNLDTFFGVGPGAGLWIDDGTEHGVVMMPTYSYSNQLACFIYSNDGGATWKRSQNASTTSWSSESCLIQLDDTTVRHFYRSGTTTLQYTDHTFVDGEWVAGDVVTMNNIVRRNNNQVSAIRHSKTIDGKPVIIYSTAAATDARKNGKLYVFTVDMDAEGKPMTLVATYDNDPTTETDLFAYSSIAELEDGSIGLLYEHADAAITFKRISLEELAPGLVFEENETPDDGEDDKPSIDESEKYTITYNLKGGENNKNNPATYTKAGEEIILQAPTKKGYSFVGWYSDSACTEQVTKIESGSTGDVTLYAKWKSKTYEISYKLDGGKNSTKNPKSYKVTSSTIKLQKPTKKGYTFVNWYSDKKLTKKVTQIKTGSTGSITLYAKWKANKYDITYKLSGGKNSSKNPKSYTVESKSITLKNPTKKGYTFKGWYADKNYKKKVTKIKKGSTGKVTLYAKWKKK